MSARRFRALGALVLVAALGASPGATASAGAQVRWRDLVVTMGGSLERYTGDFPSAAVPLVDSATEVVSVVGEMGVRGSVLLLENRTRSFEFAFDGGMRQSAALGFRTWDYAPREWVGSASGRLSQSVASWGTLVVGADVRARSVRDRPPMPFFLQPGYADLQGRVGVLTRSFDGVTFDAQVDLEHADYHAPAWLPQLDLLDRTSSGLEAGARWGGSSTVRFYGGFRWTDYSRQGSFDPTDPYRRDHTARVGLEWGYEGDVVAQVGVDGSVNRSNSNRPEYDALSARALVSAPLPRDFSLIVYALLTTKSYVHDPEYTSLVPGEEADNASIAYLQVSRPLAGNLDGAFRFGWTRAETDFGGAYYQRLGASVQLNYRPAWF